MAAVSSVVDQHVSCVHCGQPVGNRGIEKKDKSFCCQGCLVIYELLHEHTDDPACPVPTLASASNAGAERFAFLDEPEIKSRLLQFRDAGLCTVTFHIPQMHCSSCIWVLEHLYKFDRGIVSSRVNFLKKELFVVFEEKSISLRRLVELLSAIGYEPQLSLEHLEKRQQDSTNRSLYLRLAVAGFAFGNIMLLTLPDYLAFESFARSALRPFFGWVSLLLALPVFLYSSFGYFASAWRGLRYRTLNIDVPISLGILVLFGRSVYEIAAGVGGGYLDSLAGLVFFLLIGKVFQQKTYHALTFDRDFRAYFPISVTRIREGQERTVALSELRPQDEILIRNEELIPADSVLLSEEAWIDYSFVTGESRWIKKQKGDLIFAGGRQRGTAIRLKVIKEVSQSYLTRLWNHEVFRPEKPGRLDNLTDRLARHFTLIILAIATAALLYWLPQDAGLALAAFTAVLIVACPCALALSAPFALGNALRLLARRRFYAKNTVTIEKMAQVDTLVFDKTGTLTQQGGAKLQFVPLNGARPRVEHWRAVKSVARQSTHPLSMAIYQNIKGKTAPVREFREVKGAGVEGVVEGKLVRIGSAGWVGLENETKPKPHAVPGGFGARTWVSLDGRILGCFTLQTRVRKGVTELLRRLQQHYELVLLTGDTEYERRTFERLFGNRVSLYFRQNPENKLDRIRMLQRQGKKVMMIGDGLNDAGALKQSDVGVALTEDTTSFSPACDAILHAEELPRLPQFLRYARESLKVVKVSFILSFLYNLVGLSFAVSGHLSPLIAAILMPVSSITVVAFATSATYLLAKRRLLV